MNARVISSRLHGQGQQHAPDSMTTIISILRQHMGAYHDNAHISLNYLARKRKQLFTNRQCRRLHRAWGQAFRSMGKNNEPSRTFDSTTAQGSKSLCAMFTYTEGGIKVCVHRYCKILLKCAHLYSTKTTRISCASAGE